MLVAALSLRGPIVAPTPVLVDIEGDLGINAATAGLLTTAPVLMFAVLTPVAALVIRRAGAEIALMLSLSGVLVGTLVRALPGFGWMLAGLADHRGIHHDRERRHPGHHPAGCRARARLARHGGVHRDPERRVAPHLARHGSAGLGRRLERRAGASGACVTLAGVVLWGVHLARERREGRGWGSRDSGEQRDASARPASASTGPLDAASLTGPMPAVGSAKRERTMLRRPVVWLLVGAFGAQTFGYYAMSTWLPTLVADTLGVGQAAAGALASIFQGMGIAARSSCRCSRGSPRRWCRRR